MNRLSSSAFVSLAFTAAWTAGCTTTPPASLDCTSDSECPAGTVCDVVSHFCRATQPLPDAFFDLDAAIPDVGFPIPDVGIPIPDVGIPIPDVGVPFDVGVATPDSSFMPDAGPRGMAFVISQVPLTYSGNDAPGVDIDGMKDGIPGECTDQIDYTSPISGANGVDNQFLGLATLLEPTVHVENEIHAGRYLIGVRLSEVDDWVTDSAVTVELVRLATNGAAPLPSGHGLAADQTFRVVASLGSASASISGARIAVATTIDLPTWYRYGTNAVRIHDVTLRIDVRTPTAPVLELGGAIPVTELTAYGSSAGLPLDPDTLDAISGPDLAPDASGSSCAQMSAGLAPVLVAAMFP